VTVDPAPGPTTKEALTRAMRGLGGALTRQQIAQRAAEAQAAAMAHCYHPRDLAAHTRAITRWVRYALAAAGDAEAIAALGPPGAFGGERGGAASPPDDPEPP